MGQHDIGLRVKHQHDVPFRDWMDGTGNGRPVILTIVITEDGRAWLPITPLCRALGIRSQEQLQRLQEHAVLCQMVAELRILTRGGPQLSWCIERRGVGFWWGGIQLAKVRPGVRERLLEYQWKLVDAADRLLNGEVDVDPHRAQLATHDAQIAGLTRFALSLEQRIGKLEDGQGQGQGQDQDQEEEE